MEEDVVYTPAGCRLLDGRQDDVSSDPGPRAEHAGVPCAY